MRRVERILEGKEDDRLLGKREENNGKRKVVAEEVEEREIENTEQKWYGLHLLPEVPGMEIVKSLGIVHVYSDPNDRFGFVSRVSENDVKEVWLKLKEKAIISGANAVVNVRVETSGIGGLVDGNGDIYPSIYAYGEMVIVRPKA